MLSVGERLSSQLVAAALRARGLPGLAVDARDVFRTDARHGDATVDLGPSRRLVLARRADWERHVPVVTGFIGRGPDGATTTLGRNGSDYAATTLAALLGASEVTIWTDVGGVMTADPELVEEAYPVPRLTWHEAQELAHFGLRMFHRRTVLPLEQSGGSLRIRSTVDAGGGTVIDAQGNPDPHRPTFVTSLEHLALLAVESRRAVAGDVPRGSSLLGAGGGAAPRLDRDAVRARTEPGLVVDAGAAKRAPAVLETALRDLLSAGEVELASLARQCRHAREAARLRPRRGGPPAPVSRRGPALTKARLLSVPDWSRPRRGAVPPAPRRPEPREGRLRRRPPRLPPRAAPGARGW